MLVTLYNNSTTRTFNASDYEIEWNESFGGIKTLTFFKAASGVQDSNLERVTLEFSNKALSELTRITEARVMNSNLQSKMVDVNFTSVLFAGKRFYLNQAESEIRKVLESSSMPVQKAKFNKVVSELNKSRQTQIEKQATKQAPKRDLSAFVAKHKEGKQKPDDVKCRDEIIKSVKAKLQAQRQVDLGFDDKTGNFVSNGEQVELSKAADLQLLSCIQHIKKCVGDLSKLTTIQQNDFAEMIKAMAYTQDAAKLESMVMSLLKKWGLK